MQDRGPRNCPLPPKGHTVVGVVAAAAATVSSLPSPSAAAKPRLLLLPPPGMITEEERERGEFLASTLTASTRVCTKLGGNAESGESRELQTKLEAQVENRQGMTVAHRAANSPTLGRRVEVAAA